MVIDKIIFKQVKITQSPLFVQLIGEPGSGCHRLALDFIKPAKKAAWISLKWSLYAPTLWNLAKDRHIDLLGIECTEKKNFRNLCKTLLDSQIFDGWIFDHLKLTAAEGAFLQKLLRSFQTPQKILIIDDRPHHFCRERIHIHLSHHKYRLRWSKGGPSSPKFKAASILTDLSDFSMK